jgi:hypothetical protein
VTKKPFLTRLKLMLTGAGLPSAAPAPEQRPATPAVHAPQDASPFDYGDKRIPTASSLRIGTIQQLLMEIESQAKLANGGRDALEEARRIQNAYLPDLMNSYFVIPPSHRAEIFRRTGKSASFQLNERLDTMIDELRRISAGFAAGQIDSFSVNLKFIDKRFRDQNGNDPFS